MLKVRPIHEDEIDEVARLRVRSWQSGYAGIVPEEFLAALDPAEFAARLRDTSKRPAGAEALCAIEDGRIVGHAAFGPYRSEEGKHGELYSIYVLPEDWGTGAGHGLFAAARERLAAAGFSDMRLWVLEDNHRARRFYERQGMRPDGEREVWVPRGHTVELPELRYAAAL
jgi:ribosomal protein S18 acetylase RimI-like enzyme